MVQQEVRALGSRYQLERLLGSGAMGQVWLARDLRAKDGRDKVAAKLLREEYAGDAQIVTRFVQERSILLDLKHPHIVAVRDLVVDGGDLGIVMDLVEGADLRTTLAAAGTLRPAEAARITADVLEALAAAHAKSVLHRDVKPDNVLLDTAEPPFVRLTDFGIARLAEATTVRMTGVLGTAQYIAPEVFTVEQVSPAADVYGAGVMLYELLVGRTPFAGQGTDYAVAYRHVTVAPPRIVGAPRELWALLDTMLAKSPAARPSATTAAASLRGLLPALADLAPLPPMPTPEWTDAAAQQTTVRADDGHIRDANATMLKGDRLVPDGPAGPAASAQPGAALLPGAADPQAGGSETMLRDPRSERPAVDVPTARGGTADEHRLRRRILVGLGAVVGLVVLGGGGFLLFGHKGSSKPGKVDTTQDVITGAGVDDDAPFVGLTVTRTPSYSQKDRTLTMTIAYASSTATFAGRFYESVRSDQPNAACPALAWSEQRDTDTDPDDCGWAVTTDEVTKGQQQTASYTIPWAPPSGTPVAQAMATYTTAEQAATDKALAELTGADTDYAAQRLQSVSAKVFGTPTVAGAIDFRVYPVWTSQPSVPDYQDPIYDAQHPTGTALATALGGISAPVSPDCGTAVSGTGGRLHANQATSATQPCTITLNLGGQPVTSDPFSIGTGVK